MISDGTRSAPVELVRADTAGRHHNLLRGATAGPYSTETNMLGGLITIAGGILAASGFIIKRSPNAQQLIDKIAPYQGWIGVVMFIWGIKEVIGSVTGLAMLSTAPVAWIFWTLSGVADLLVGFLLGFGLITHYALSKNAAAMEKGQRIKSTLMSIQAPLGVLAIIMGALYIALPFVLHA